MAAIVLLSPQIPLMFMGEEWGTAQPFLYFSDLGDELAENIRRSRAEEIRELALPQGAVPPDPMAETTFASCKLDWEQRDQDEHARLLSLYRRLIGIRREQVV